MVGEGGVGGGHVEDAGGGRAEGDGRGGGEVGGALGDAEGDRGVLDLLGADVLGHLGIDRVDGLVGGLADGDGAVVDVVLVGGGVAGGAGGGLDGALVGAVVAGVGGDGPAAVRLGAVGEGGGEDEGLEGGADLEVAAGGVVDELPGVVDAAVQGDDVPGGGIDGGAARADVAVGVALVAGLGQDVVLDGLDEGVLLLLLEGGDDAVSAGGEGVRVDDLVAGQVVLDGLDDVTALTGEGGAGLGLDGDGEVQGLAVGAAEPAFLDHAGEYVVPAGEDGVLVLGVGDDVVVAGGVEQGGEVGALTGVQVFDVLAVVGVGGGLDAVGVAAEVAGVEVALQDLVLALLAVELDRDEELLGLADDGLLLAEVVVLDVLLGDGGTALASLAGDGVPPGAEGGGHVDGVLGVEVPVLGGQHGVPDGLGDAAQPDVLAVGLSVAGDDVLAVRVQVDVGLGGRGGVGGGDVDELVTDEEAADEEHGEEEDAAEGHAPGGYGAAPAGAFGALAAFRALLAPGRAVRVGRCVLWAVRRTRGPGGVRRRVLGLLGILGVRGRLRGGGVPGGPALGTLPTRVSAVLRWLVAHDVGAPRLRTVIP